MPNGNAQAIVVVAAGLVVLTAALSWFIRKVVRQADALERANRELAASVSAEHASRMRAEAEAAQKARLAALLDAALDCAPIGFAFFDRQFRFLRVNQKLAEMNGRSIQEHVGETMWEIDPRLAELVEPQLRRVLVTRKPMMNVEFAAPTPALPGEERNWLASFFPIETGDELFGVGVVVADVTEIKRLEEQLLQAQKMEAVGRLAGGVAHDFNNLLTVINSYAELILFDPEISKGREEIQEIRGATARAAKLTRQLLAFSRRQAMEPRIVNPNDVLRGVEAMLRRLIDGNIAVVADLSPDTPLIRVDPGQLEQVAMNLAINAADAMPEGGTLSISTSSRAMPEEFLRRHADLRPGIYAMISVRDTGHGMDAETLAQIFEPFFTTKEPGRGTGLGLSTVYGIVKQSDGHVSVETVPGEGTEFTVYLPAVDIDEMD